MKSSFPNGSDWGRSDIRQNLPVWSTRRGHYNHMMSAQRSDQEEIECWRKASSRLPPGLDLSEWMIEAENCSDPQRPKWSMSGTSHKIYVKGLQEPQGMHSHTTWWSAASSHSNWQGDPNNHSWQTRVKSAATTASITPAQCTTLIWLAPVRRRSFYISLLLSMN